MISKDDIAREILRRQKLQQRAEDLKKAALSPLSHNQLAFVVDQSRRQCVITSRQSGKTTGLLKKLTQAAHEIRGADLLYVATTRDAARDPFWERLKLYCDEHKIKATPNETMLEMRFDNGAKISLRGVPDIKRANRLRGPTRHMAVVDEAQNYPDQVLKTLIVDVLEPSLMAHEGKLVLAGTPGLQPKGFFYDASTNVAYKQHRWGLESNPIYEGRVDAVIADILAQYGWTRDTPSFRREYLGEWCSDTEAAVYRVTERNLYSITDDTIPGTWRYVVGIDFGYRDEAAFVVIGWRDNDPTLYVVHEDSEQELLVDGYVSRIRELIKRFAPIAVVADAGALGKTLVETLVVNHSLPIEAADKRDKPTAIRQVNSDLAKGAILMTRDGLFDQMSTLRWHPDKIGLIEQPGMPNDRCDAFLYAYRKAWHYLQKPLPPKPAHGSEEYFKRIEREIRAEVQKQAEYDPWQADPWANG